MKQSEMNIYLGVMDVVIISISTSDIADPTSRALGVAVTLPTPGQ